MWCKISAQLGGMNIWQNLYSFENIYNCYKVSDGYGLSDRNANTSLLAFAGEQFSPIDKEESSEEREAQSMCYC